MQVVNASLLDAPKDFAITQCISEDCAMGITSYGKEIPCLALDIRERYPSIADYCKSYGASVGDIILYHGEDGRRIFNLVTKKQHYGKPSYETMENALHALKWCAKKTGSLKLAIPRLGCGLDGLNWNRVSGMVERILVGSGIEVVLYNPSSDGEE